MHADEQPVDAALVRSLLEEQFPVWAGLSVERVPSIGTDNALYMLRVDLDKKDPAEVAKEYLSETGLVK